MKIGQFNMKSEKLKTSQLALESICNSERLKVLVDTYYNVILQ